MVGLNGFGHVIVNGGGFAFLCAALVFCVAAPNTQQIMRDHGPALEAPREPRAGRASAWKWQPVGSSAALVAFGATACIVRLWATGEFLYFQF